MHNEYPLIQCSEHQDEYYKYICTDLNISKRLLCSDCLAFDDGGSLLGRVKKIPQFLQSELSIKTNMSSFYKDKDANIQKFISKANLEEFIIQKNLEEHQQFINQKIDECMKKVTNFFKRKIQEFGSKLKDIELQMLQLKSPLHDINFAIMQERDFVEYIEDLLSKKSKQTGTLKEKLFLQEMDQIKRDVSDQNSNLSTRVQSYFMEVNQNIEAFYNVRRWVTRQQLEIFSNLRINEYAIFKRELCQDLFLVEMNGLLDFTIDLISSDKINQLFEIQPQSNNNSFQHNTSKELNESTYSEDSSFNQQLTPTQHNNNNMPRPSKIRPSMILPSQQTTQQLVTQYSGIKENISLKPLIQEGWQVIYDQPYSHATSFDDLIEIKKESNRLTRICVGAYHKNDPNKIVIAAFANADKVLTPTKSTKEAELVDDAYWYMVKGFSFGFSDTWIINLNNGDMNMKGKKLSWHLNGSGGYRVSNEVCLDYSKEWNKILLVYDSVDRS